MLKGVADLERRFAFRPGYTVTIDAFNAAFDGLAHAVVGTGRKAGKFRVPVRGKGRMTVFEMYWT